MSAGVSMLNTNGLNSAYSGQVPPVYSSEAIRAGVTQIARNTDSFATSFLPENNGPKVVVHRHYYGYDYTPSWFYFYPQPVYIVGGRRREDEGSSRAALAILSTVLGGIALYALGKALGRFRAASSDLQNAQHDRARLNDYGANAAGSDQTAVETAKHSVDLKGRICQRVKNSALTDVILRVGFAVGCGLLLASAFATAPGLLYLMGAVTALTTGGAMLLKWGFESTDRQNQLDALAIRASVQQIGL